MMTTNLNTAQDEIAITTALLLLTIYIGAVIGLPFIGKHGFLLLKVYVAAFLVNFLWEVNHSVLYETCLNLPLQRVVQILLKSTIGDAIWITLLSTGGLLFFHTASPLLDPWFFTAYTIASIATAYIVEKIALHRNFWTY